MIKSQSGQNYQQNYFIFYYLPMMHWEPEESEPKKHYNWRKEEHLLYAAFIERNQEIFVGRVNRLPPGFFHRMAAELNIGKNNYQCRNHHQNMLRKYKSISGIIENAFGKDSKRGDPGVKKEEESSVLPQVKIEEKEEMVTSIIKSSNRINLSQREIVKEQQK